MTDRIPDDDRQFSPPEGTEGLLAGPRSRFGTEAFVPPIPSRYYPMRYQTGFASRDAEVRPERLVTRALAGWKESDAAECSGKAVRLQNPG